MNLKDKYPDLENTVSSLSLRLAGDGRYREANLVLDMLAEVLRRPCNVEIDMRGEGMANALKQDFRDALRTHVTPKIKITYDDVVFQCKAVVDDAEPLTKTLASRGGRG